MASGSKTFFEEHFANEILQNERLRAIILAGLFGFVLLALLALYSFFREEFLRLFRGSSSFYAMLIFAGLVVR